MRKYIIGAIVLVAVLLIGSGAYIYARPSPTQTSVTSADQNKNYLIIKEWGIQFEKPAGLSDLQYAIYNPNNKPNFTTFTTITFTTQQLINLDKFAVTPKSETINPEPIAGKCASYSIGSMSRYTVQEYNEMINDKYGLQYGNGANFVKVGNYYYGFSVPQQICTYNSQYAELEAKQTSELHATVLKSLSASP